MNQEKRNQTGPDRIRIENKTYDEERALYHLCHGDLVRVRFEGPADGESVLKEARDVNLQDCSFSLRYPLWHVDTFTLKESEMDDKTRAPIWYSRHGQIENCKLYGVKAVRECQDISLKKCEVISPEFGWKSQGVYLKDTEITSEYIFLDSSDIRLENVHLKGKYTFQYVQNLEIRNSILDTKDAFWHAKNVHVYDSVVKGEYLAWFSDGLTLTRCKIIGTQPLCYCKNLTLVDCTMEGADFAFEYSDVEADVKGDILSVKNPRSGRIVCDSVGEIITENPVMECTGKVELRRK
ncbi:MAG: DUF3737 family protein [Clostridia bacterium]|nr:DUF3737 family protein [Clostridia bacterium]